VGHMLKVHRRGIAALAVALVGAVSIGCGDDDEASNGAGGASGADKPAKITVATLPITSNAAVDLAKQKGWFKEENLEVTIKQVPNPPAAVATVQGNQANFGYAPTMAILNAISAGVPLKITQAADGYPEGAWDKIEAGEQEAKEVDDTAIYAGADAGVTSPKDLEGKTVAVPARKTQLEITIAKTVKEDGGDPSKIKWIALGFPEMQAALDAKRVDAAGLVDPFNATAEQKGAKYVASPGISTFEEGAVGVWMTTESYAEQNKDVVERFNRVIAKANAYSNDHHPELQELAAKTTKTPIDVIKAGHMPYWNTEVKPEDVDKAAAAMVELGYIKSKPDPASVLVG
jgi:ABC-type nitrate/sulfonate/bicarbonate transport system substrate-binding protein